MNSLATTPEIPSDQVSIPGAYYLRARPEIVELVPIAAQRILDVGCGAGGLSATLKGRQTAEIHGVEIVEQAAAHARHHLDHVWNCGIEAALPELPDGYYDCIVIADVLEHLLDPLFVISELKKKLTSNGTLIASIPNIQNWGTLSELLQGKWDYRSEGILDRTHLRFFTRKSVEELFWSAGFRIARLSRTRRGEPPPSAFLDKMKDIGLSAKELALDGETFQFLIEAELPDLSVKPKVAIVVLNWNGKQDTLECLESIGKLDYPNYQTVVVDNGSTDDSVDAIRTKFPNVFVLQTGANLGYAGGNNVGIKWAISNNSEYIFILNNDVIVDQKCLHELVNADLVADCGVLGPANFYYEKQNELWTIGATRKSTPTPGYKLLADGDNKNDWPLPLMVDSIVGSSILIRREVIEKVGLLDERFFLCWEEFDFCARSIDAGFKCLYVPHASIWHKVGSALGELESPLRRYFNIRNRLLWASKHCSRSEQRQLKQDAKQVARQIFVQPFAVPQGSQVFVKRLLWAATSWIKSIRRRLAQPANKVTLYALRDFYLKRFGDCPHAIRQLAAKSSAPRD